MPGPAATLYLDMPGIFEGGVEEWTYLLCRDMDRSRLEPAIVYDGPLWTQHGRRLAQVARILPYAQARREWGANTQNSVALFWNDVGGKRYADFPGPLVFVAHGEGEWTIERARINQDRCTHLAAVGRSSAAVYARTAAGTPEKARRPIQVIENGCDLAKLPASRKPGRLKGFEALPRPWCGYVGRWSWEKRPRVALDAARELGGSAFYVVPEFSRHSVQEAARSVPGVPVVHWDFRRLADLYGAVDAIFCCGMIEGGPLVALEALASGCPLVATRVGMLPDLLARYGAGGPLFPTVEQRINVPIPGAVLAEGFRAIDAAQVERARQLIRLHHDSRRMAARWSAYLASLLP